mmetsp:Transcript_8702/g.15547  ORF Transcript_8702/g.15547 Transcript_8702/m.15547 type:complete len:914 (+) Transcript_8702:160-2901(+)|eukprot:CAMPEP_0205910042 /NCGR_PEP_ID=MMETSP1325-20131115/4213_1 /ASSEMBLY_ACC=CAM_ASM_000708 /TAXON_ID=236786 /ORGANISM="Florenciella sp., Strain RCC1007" /LENGTH=913 /DNA_ID=CAMNT_0053276371 /DNA_START=150 /DNA_END=2891 /DNA_ORIENTATION=+
MGIGFENDKATKLLNDGDAIGALALLDKILASPDMTEQQKATILANKGLCLDQLGRAEDAVAVLEEALALKEDPGIAEVRDQIAVSILTDKAVRTAERGQYEEAADLFTECIEKDPEGQNFWLFNKALMIHRLGRLEEATALFEDVYRSDPSNTQVYSLLGNNLCKLKRWAEASPVLEAALAEGADLNTRYNYAVCLLNTDKRPEAKDAFEKVLEEDPDYDLALDALAMLNARFGSELCQKGDFAAAIPLLEQAIGRNPKDTTLYNLGAAMMREKHYHEAKECFAKVLEMTPDHKMAPQGIQLVDKELRREEQRVAKGEAAAAFQPDYLVKIRGKGGRPPPRERVVPSPAQQEEAQTWLAENADVIMALQDKKDNVGVEGMGEDGGPGEPLTEEEQALLDQAAVHQATLAAADDGFGGSYGGAILAETKPAVTADVGAALAAVINNPLPPPPSDGSGPDFAEWAQAVNRQMGAMQNALVETANQSANVHTELKLVSRRMDLIEGRLSKHGISPLDPSGDVSLADVGEAVTKLSRRVAICESIAAGGMASGGMALSPAYAQAASVPETPELTEARENLATAPDGETKAAAKEEFKAAAAAAVAAMPDIVEKRAKVEAMPDGPEKEAAAAALAEEEAEIVAAMLDVATPPPLAQTCDTPEETSELEAEKAQVAAMADGDDKKAAKKALAAKLGAKLGGKFGGGAGGMPAGGDGSFWGMVQMQGDRLKDLEELVTGGSGIKVMPKAGEGGDDADSLPMTVAEDPAFAKYFKMLKMGLPPPAVAQKMAMEGLDSQILNNPGAPSPNNPEKGEGGGGGGGETEFGTAPTIVERLGLAETEIRRLKNKHEKLAEKVASGTTVHPMMQMPDFGGGGGWSGGGGKKGKAVNKDQAEMMGELKRACERRAKARARMGLTVNE